MLSTPCRSAQKAVLLPYQTRKTGTMIKSISRIITGKVILVLIAFAAVAFVAESCGQKHACGSKHQKRKKNNRLKRNTNFMTYKSKKDSLKKSLPPRTGWEAFLFSEFESCEYHFLTCPIAYFRLLRVNRGEECEELPGRIV